MNIFYHISPYPTLLENMVAKIYEASSPNAEVQSFTILEKNSSGVATVGAGHQVPNSVAFTGCDKVTHVVRLFTASGTLLHWYDVNPTEDVVIIFDPIFFKVGDGGTYTPTAGQPTLTNPAFTGLIATDLSIFQEGFRFLLPWIEYTMAGTVVTLINGTNFEDAQGWYIFKKTKAVTTIVNDSVVGKGIGGFIDIVADTNYIAGHLRKLIRFSGTGNYTFPVATSIPIGYNHVFTNFGTNPSTPQINFANGTLLYGGAPKSSLVLPFGSTCWFTWDGTNWNCTVYQINTTLTASVEIVGKGSVAIGDVTHAPGDSRTILEAHGLNLAYAYKVIWSLKGTTASRTFDDNVIGVVYDLQPNSFKIGINDVFGGTQNLTFDYILVKS